MSGSKRDKKRRRYFRRTFYCCELCHPPNGKAEASKNACRGRAVQIPVAPGLDEQTKRDLARLSAFGAP